MKGEVSVAGSVSIEDDKVWWYYYFRQRWSACISSWPSGLSYSTDLTVMPTIQLMVSTKFRSSGLIIVNSFSFLLKMLKFEFIFIVKCLLYFVSISGSTKLAEVSTDLLRLWGEILSSLWNRAEQSWSVLIMQDVAWDKVLIRNHSHSTFSSHDTFALQPVYYNLHFSELVINQINKFI